MYNKVGNSSMIPADNQVDISWQLTLQRVWENLVREKGMPLYITLLLYDVSHQCKVVPVQTILPFCSRFGSFLAL